MAYAYNTALCAISIHAPREGSDPMDEIGQGQKMNFYPRSPRGERRVTATPDRGDMQFLSTLPARGATMPRAVLALP